MTASHTPRIESHYHEAHDSTLCPSKESNVECANKTWPRLVDCDSQARGQDIMECTKCGFQWVRPCPFHK